MDTGQRWMTDPEDLDDPEEDEDFWEDDELTAEELTRWQDAMQAAEQADRARVRPGLASDQEGPGGRADEGSVPDLIAAVLAAAGDPALMSDAELARSLAGWHAIGARAAGRELRMTEELLRRHRPRVWDRRADRAESRRENLDGTAEAAGTAGPGPAGPEPETPGPARPEAAGPGKPGPEPGTSGPGTSGPGTPERVMPAVVPSREAASEIALALTATEYAAQAQAQLAADLSRRLPAAFGELDAGRADLSRIRVLAEGTRFLSDADAGKVDGLLAARLGQWTTGELRDRVRRAVIRIDPAAAERRARRAARTARFALYGNDDQTATAAVERMPPHLGAAVRARVNAIARAAKSGGMTGPLHLLEAKVATGLLLGTLPDIPPPDGPGGADGPGPAPGPWDDGWPAGWFPSPPEPPAPGATRDPATGADGDRQGAAGPAGDDCDVDDCTIADRGVRHRDVDDHGRGDFGPADPANFTPPDPTEGAGPLNFTPPDPGGGGAGPADFTPPSPGSGPAGPVNLAPLDPGDEVRPAGEMSWPPVPAQAGRDGPGCHGLPAWLRPAVPGRIRLTAAWRTLTGTSPEPGELTWIGPITPAQARDLAAAAAADPSCTWQLVITDDHGHAIATTTLRTRRPHGTGPPPGLISEVTVTIQHTLAAGLGRDSRARDQIAAALAHADSTASTADLVTLTGLLARAIPAANTAAARAADRAAADATAGGCAHTMEASGYRVTGKLRRWLTTRDRTCRHPVCRQPAAHCDQDHTVAYHRGGRTCPCNLGGLCRTHHELKQLPGWQLTQDAQGYFTWRTPAGLTYRKEPYCYPV